jgi:hypothetical protein
MLQINLWRKSKQNILCSTSFFPENRAVYEKMWENMVQPDRPQMTVWRMRIVCWITKARDTHKEQVILVVFPRKILIRLRCFNVRLQVCRLSCFIAFAHGNGKGKGKFTLKQVTKTQRGR